MVFGKVLIFINLFAIIKSQSELECELNDTCGECIQILGCVWCMDEITLPSGSLTNCLQTNSTLKNKCPDNKLVEPKFYFKILKNKPLQSTNSDAVHISPQKVQIHLRRDEEFSFNFTYAQVKNYPIDLYYIMDFSASMEIHKRKLSKLGNKLADTMRNMTSNFRIGFGSFVDKVVLPYVSTMPKKLISPCKLVDSETKKYLRCASPYSFKNHMSLSNNHTKFSKEVSKTPISGNLDAPESHFDAIMQAIVCNEEIGWRDKARHLLVVSSDDHFHIAGDGKLGGVVKANDAKCHLKNNVYDADLIYDYPSVSQLNYIAKKNNINIIFAIAPRSSSILDAYVRLSEQIENSNVGVLDEQSDNVVKLIFDNYNKIVDLVTIDVSKNENVEVKISSNCAKPIQRGCSDIHLGEKVNFTASIKLLSCKNYDGKPIYLTLKPASINESLVVELHLNCQCNCEKKAVKNAAQCSNSGDFVCGICDCLKNRYGSKCECDGSYSMYSNETNCKENKPNAVVCSGLGECKCGKCECMQRPNKNEKITGKYCQCNNYSCERQNGLLCSGKGTCSCGVCICDSGWTGNACECDDNTLGCIPLNNRTASVCNGKGICKCGKCECYETYTGKFCDECPTCAERCDELEKCVKCKVYGTGQWKGAKCDLKCNQYQIDAVEKIYEDMELKNSYKFCRIIDTDNCKIVYKYGYDSNKNIFVKVVNKKNCPPNVIAWTAGIIGSILLAGVVMLIVWKICTDVYDGMEYQRFQKESKNLKWNQTNPLYVQATSTFYNPIYKR